MKRLVEFEVGGSSGETVVVEVDDSDAAVGEESAARGGEPDRAQRSLEDALERVKPAASILMEKVRSLAEDKDESPMVLDEATIQFGIKLTGKVGAVLASAALEANYQVTLTWKHK